jgi:hypothetical protein
VALGSIPSTIVPFNTTAFQLLVAFLLACIKRFSSLSPSCLWNISSGLIDTVVSVFGPWFALLQLFSDIALSILPSSTTVSLGSFVSSPSGEHQVALGSVPSAVIPFNTTALSLGVAFHLALGEAGSSCSPSGLMDVLVVLVNTVVGVLLVSGSAAWVNEVLVLLNSETRYSSLPFWNGKVLIWSIEGLLSSLSSVMLIESDLVLGWNIHTGHSVVAN